MGKKGKTLNSIYVPPDLLKKIFLRLPLKSLVKSKTVSKEWRSILDSKSFSEMHLSFQKSGKRRRKILAAYKCDCCDWPNLSPVTGMEGDEEIVYLHCDPARPSMSCDGLVCIPEPGWVNVLNPSTGELRRLASGPDPEPSVVIHRYRGTGNTWFALFPGNWAMGFGRDRVTGSYKVVRMFFDPVECDVIAVETGEWRKLSPPPYEVDARRRSACVNGTIYWLELGCVYNKLVLDHYEKEFSWCYKILALDLHTEEFHDVKSLPPSSAVRDLTQILNLDDRLVMSTTRKCRKELEIWSMDAKVERWSKTYSISLVDVAATLPPWKVWWFTPVAVSKDGDVLISDNKKSLFKHCPRSNVIRLLSPSTCCVISPYLENLVRLHKT